MAEETLHGSRGDVHRCIEIILSEDSSPRKINGGDRKSIGP